MFSPSTPANLPSPEASPESSPCAGLLNDRSLIKLGQFTLKKATVKPSPATPEPSESTLSITPNTSQEQNASEQPPAVRKKLPSYPYEDMSTRVRIMVGDAREFHVQKELLCKHSAVFKEICSESLTADQQPIRIMHADSDTFASFVGYIHDEDVYLATGIPIIVHQKSDGPSHAKRQSCFLQLAKCYILGWDLSAYTFCNAVMDVLVEISQKGNRLGFIAGGTEEIREYVASQANSTPLHELLDDNYAGFAKYTKRLELFPRMAELQEMVAFFKVLEGISKLEALDRAEDLKFSWERDLCYYHKHPDQEEGYSCMKKIELNIKKATKKRKMVEKDSESGPELRVPKKRQVINSRKTM